jgi:hypothetical protein
MSNEKKDEKIDMVMKDSEMWEFFADLYETNYWRALERWMFIQDATIVSALKSLDPMTSRTAIARNQGFLSGIWTLKSIVKDAHQKRLNRENGKNEESGGDGDPIYPEN